MTGESFLDQWGRAAATSLGFFWMALWAFCLGYLISSMVQVLLTRERMQEVMGRKGPRAVGLATFFGFVSSSCSFAALSTARALFQKGAGLVPSLAFLLASTNLVVELGIVIFVFLSWQFVVGEYVGGVLLILLTWLLVKLTLPKGLEEAAREHAGRAAGGEEAGSDDWRELARSREGWRRIGRRYGMEWGMVWKDVTFGFTVAGVIAAFVPAEFFRTLFVGSGAEGGPAAWQVAAQAVIGPVAAFFTFIGSMGNIPLAAVLFGSGVSFAGVMAFIFSDLVVFPVLRISAGYFGRKMAVYILGVFLVALVVSSLLLHHGLQILDLLPSADAAKASLVAPEERFGLDRTLILNVLFLLASGLLAWLARPDSNGEDGGHEHASEPSWTDRLMSGLALGSLAWLVVGGVLWLAA